MLKSNTVLELVDVSVYNTTKNALDKGFDRFKLMYVFK